MGIRTLVLNITVIVIIVWFPHTGFIPNFGYSIPILLIVWLSLKYTQENLSNIGFSFKRFKIRSLLIGGLTAISALSFMQVIFFPILEQFVVFEDTEVALYAFITENKWQYTFVLIMGWLIGGFYEEIIFHGFIFTRLERMILRPYSTVVAISITVLLFGLYHYQLGVLGVINAFIIGGIYLGLYLFYERDLWYAICCHGVYNTVVVTMIYFGYL